MYTKRTGVFLLGLNGVTSVDQVKKVDDYTVDFTLSAPSGRGTPFLLTFGFGASAIYDSTEARKHAPASDPYAREWLARNAAGYGPYAITRYGPDGAEVILEARSDYWGPKPAVKRIIQSSVSESSLRLQLLLSNTVHYAAEMSPVEIAQVLKNKTATASHINDTTFAYVALTQRPPWNARKIRQAIARALPYDDILKTVYRGRAQPYRSILAPFVEGYTEEFGYRSNLNAAKQVLSTVKEPLALAYGEGLPIDEQIAILVQGALRSAGLDVRLDKQPRSIFETRKFARKNELQFFVDNFASPGFISPDYYFTWLATPQSPNNWFHWTNAQLNQVMETLKTANGRTRAAAIREGQKIVMRDLPIFPLAWTGKDYAHAKFLHLPKAHTGSGIPHWQDLTLSE
jgi:peptide/nickel transport system substrate-binding protein